MNRFSKEALLEHLRKRIEALDSSYNFDPDAGAAQVVGRTPDVILAYGEFRALTALVAAIVGGYIK